jgi:hypothetical protein
MYSERDFDGMVFALIAVGVVIGLGLVLVGKYLL